jgi:hypothetical protein
VQIGSENFCEVLQQIRGPAAVAEWRQLQRDMRPLAQASTVLPPAALRADAGVLVTALARYLPSLLQSGATAIKLAGPFSDVRGVPAAAAVAAAGAAAAAVCGWPAAAGGGAARANPLAAAWPPASAPRHPAAPPRRLQVIKDVKDPFIRNWLDLLCFLLSGLPAKGTIAAEVAFMFNQWFIPDCMVGPRRWGPGAARLVPGGRGRRVLRGCQAGAERCAQRS